MGIHVEPTLALVWAMQQELEMWELVKYGHRAMDMLLNKATILPSTYAVVSLLQISWDQDLNQADIHVV